MNEHLSIPRAELEALLSKLENSQLDYAERVGRAQGYLDKWLMTAPKAKGPKCVNCGAAVAPPAMLSASGLCPYCWWHCTCPHHAGDNPRCDVHGQKSAAGAEQAVREEAPYRCANCGEPVLLLDLRLFGLCPNCYPRCLCPEFAGENPRCPIHGQKSAEPEADAVRDLLEDLAHGPVGFSVVDMHIYEQYMRDRAEKLLKADKPAPPTGDTCQMSADEHAAAADAALKDAIKQRLVTR